MSEFLTEILGILEANGNEMTYEALRAAVPPQNWRNMRGALQEGKKLGVVKQQPTFNPETGESSHFVRKVS